MTIQEGVSRIKLFRKKFDVNSEPLATLKSHSLISYISNHATTSESGLKYGEPLWVTDRFGVIFQHGDIGRGLLFVGNEKGKPCFIGPYYAGNGISINNDYGSTLLNDYIDLGKISLDFQLGNGLSWSNGIGSTLNINPAALGIDDGFSLINVHRYNDNDFDATTVSSINNPLNAAFTNINVSSNTINEYLTASSNSVIGGPYALTFVPYNYVDASSGVSTAKVLGGIYDLTVSISSRQMNFNLGGSRFITNAGNTPQMNQTTAPVEFDFRSHCLAATSSDILSTVLDSSYCTQHSFNYTISSLSAVGKAGFIYYPVICSNNPIQKKLAVAIPKQTFTAGGGDKLKITNVTNTDGSVTVYSDVNDLISFVSSNQESYDLTRLKTNDHSGAGSGNSYKIYVPIDGRYNTNGTNFFNLMDASSQNGIEFHIFNNLTDNSTPRIQLYPYTQSEQVDILYNVSPLWSRLSPQKYNDCVALTIPQGYHVIIKYEHDDNLEIDMLSIVNVFSTTIEQSNLRVTSDNAGNVTIL